MEKDIEILQSFIKQLEEYEDEEELKQAIENLINRVKELEEINKNLLDNLNHSIRSSAIRERLGIEENIPEEQMLDYIDIIVTENARLEDIEDKKVQIEYEKVFNKGVKSVENKIKEKIEELAKDMVLPETRQVLKELLEEG